MNTLGCWLAHDHVDYAWEVMHQIFVGSFATK